MESLLLEPVWLNWCVLGFGLMILEVLTPGVMLIWFGIGALLCGLLSWLLGVESWQVQSLLFAFITLVSVFMGRRFIKQAAPGKESGLNRRLEQYVGRTATLETPIKNGRGRIRLGDTYWAVIGPDLPAGAEVAVVRVDDINLVVEPASVFRAS